MATVLIVDDDPELRRLLSLRMKVGGVQSVEADGVAAALEVVATMPVDVVLIDLTMPGASGLEGIAALRASTRAMAHCPMILMTGYVDPDLDEQALLAGATAIVHKPFELRVVMRLVESELVNAGASGSTRAT